MVESMLPKLSRPLRTCTMSKHLIIFLGKRCNEIYVAY
jgi:hypothetical protein